MSENTKIEWATHTFNPWEGCQKTGSPGCALCYAEARNARFGGGVAVNWGPGAPRRRTSVANWRKPLAWNANHDAFFAEHGHRQRVFCASLADVFDNAVPVEWRAELLQLIDLTPNLDWLLLTKRIGNVVPMLKDIRRAVDGAYSIDLWPRPNIWLGATIVNQEEADRDIPKLLAVPAAKRFLSMEPLLGPVDIRWALSHPIVIAAGFLERGRFAPGLETLRRLDWVIVGGESGHGARPMHPDWARSLRDQCKAAAVPFLFKQWGEWSPESGHHTQKCVVMADGEVLTGSNVLSRPYEDGEIMFRVGKKAAGRLLDGREWNGAAS